MATQTTKFDRFLIQPAETPTALATAPQAADLRGPGVAAGRSKFARLTVRAWQGPQPPPAPELSTWDKVKEVAQTPLLPNPAEWFETTPMPPGPLEGVQTLLRHGPPVVRGAIKGVGDVVQGFSSPMNVALIAGFPLVAKVRIAKLLIEGLFTWETLQSTFKQIPESYDLFKEGKVEEGTRALVGGLASGAIAATLGTSMVRGGRQYASTMADIYREKKARVEAAARPAPEVAPVEAPAPEVAPVEAPAPGTLAQGPFPGPRETADIKTLEDLRSALRQAATGETAGMAGGKVLPKAFKAAGAAVRLAKETEKRLVPRAKPAVDLTKLGKPVTPEAMNDGWLLPDGAFVAIDQPHPASMAVAAGINPREMGGEFASLASQSGVIRVKTGVGRGMARPAAEIYGNPTDAQLRGLREMERAFDKSVVFDITDPVTRLPVETGQGMTQLRYALDKRFPEPQPQMPPSAAEATAAPRVNWGPLRQLQQRFAEAVEGGTGLKVTSPVTGKISTLRGLPEDMPGVRELARAWRKGEPSREWYERAYRSVMNIFGNRVDTEMFLDFLAATSPNTSVPGNINFAFKALARYKSGLPLKFAGETIPGVSSSNYLPAHLAGLKAALRGEELPGPKVNPFSKALKGDPNAIVVDIWIMRAFGFKRKSPTESQRAFISDAITRMAKATGDAPRQVQARLWAAVKQGWESGKTLTGREHGKPIKAFPTSVEEVLKEKQVHQIGLDLAHLDETPAGKVFPSLYDESIPFEQREAVSRQAGSVILNDTLKSFTRAKEPQRKVFVLQNAWGPGGWQDKPLVPSAQLTVVGSRGSVGELIGQIGYRLEQQEVLAHRLLTDPGAQINALRIIGANNVFGNRAVLDRFWKELRATVPELAGFSPTRARGNAGLDIINFKEGVKWNDTDIARFEQAIDGAARKLGISTETDHLAVEPMRSVNDWKEFPDGRQHLERANPTGSPALDRRLADHHRRFDWAVESRAWREAGPEASAAYEAKRGGVPRPEEAAGAGVTAPGADITSPTQTYIEGAQAKPKGQATTDQNIWARQTAAADNSGRTLAVQFSTDLLTKKSPRTSAEDYYDKLYRSREGYDRPDDFWEIPQWQAQLAHNLPGKVDHYTIRDLDEAVRFFNKAGYKNIAFSALDVNADLIAQVADRYPGRLVVGGYADMGRFRDSRNVNLFSSMREFVENEGARFEEAYDYGLFKGTKVVPRLTLSDGCRHSCAFCTVPKEITEYSRDTVMKQAGAIAKDLSARLVYLNDKTFGQAKNYTTLPDIYRHIKETNPGFEGFIVQTTAAQMRQFTPEFLRNSGIRYVELGIETFNTPILKALKKPANEKIINEAAEKLRQARIALVPNIMIGLPGETSATYARTLDWLNRNADIISHLNIYNLAVYKEAPLSKTLETLKPGDTNENVIEKSWRDPGVDTVFHEQVHGLASRFLDRGLVTAQDKADVEAIDGLRKSFRNAATGQTPGAAGGEVTGAAAKAAGAVGRLAKEAGKRLRGGVTLPESVMIALTDLGKEYRRQGLDVMQNLASDVKAAGIRLEKSDTTEIMRQLNAPITAVQANVERMRTRAQEVVGKARRLADQFSVTPEKVATAVEQEPVVRAEGTLEKGLREEFRAGGQPTAAQTKGFEFSAAAIEASTADLVETVRDFRRLSQTAAMASDAVTAERFKLASRNLEASVKQWQVFRSAAGRALHVYKQAIPEDVIQALRESAGMVDFQTSKITERVPITTHILQGLRDYRKWQPAERKRFWNDFIEQFRLNLFSVTSFTLDLGGNLAAMAGEAAAALGRDVGHWSHGFPTMPNTRGLIRAIRLKTFYKPLDAAIEGEWDRTFASEKISPAGVFTYRRGMGEPGSAMRAVTKPISALYDYLAGGPLYAKSAMDTGFKRVGALANLYRDAISEAEKLKLGPAETQNFINDYLAKLPADAARRAVEAGNRWSFSRELTKFEENLSQNPLAKLFLDTFIRWPFQFTRWAGEMLGADPAFFSKVRQGKADMEDVTGYLAKAATGWGGLYLLNQIYDRVDFNTMEYVDEDNNRVRLSNRDPLNTGLVLLAVLHGDKDRATAGLRFASLPFARVPFREGGLITSTITQLQEAARNPNNTPRQLQREVINIINRAIPGQAVLSMLKTLFDDVTREGVGANLPGVSRGKPAAISTTTGEPLRLRQKFLGVEMPAISGTPIPGATRLLDPIQKLLFRYGFSQSHPLRTPVAGLPPAEVTEDLRREWQEEFGRRRYQKLLPLTKRMAELGKMDDEHVREIISKLDSQASREAALVVTVRHGGSKGKPERRPSLRERARPKIYQVQP